MPGPIETAFVEIVAQLAPGDLESELTGAVRRAVSSATPAFNRLEQAGVEAARGVGDAFRRLSTALDVREAISALSQVEEKAVATSEAVTKRLSRLPISLDATAATEKLQALNDQIEFLGVRVRSLGSGEINPNFGEFQTDLRQTLLDVDSVIKALQELKGQSPNLKTEEAVTQLRALATATGEALRNVEAMHGQTVDIKVDDLQIEKLISDTNKAESELRTLAETHPIVHATLDEKEIVGASGRVGASAGREMDNQFERAFKRIVAFGIVGLLTRGAVQATEQLVRSGLQASAAIERVQLSLNRFFAQSANLGETATAFFGQIRQLALSTPFELVDLANTSREFLAMGDSAQQAFDNVKVLTDAIASVGGTQANIDGVTAALQKLSSTGVVSFQQLRALSTNFPELTRAMQIQGIIDELNRLHPGLNATVADFNDLRKSGLITGQVIQQGIIGEMQKIPGVAGAAAAASRTLSGALSNLKDFTQVEFADAFSGLGRELADQLTTAFGANAGAGAQLSPLTGAIRSVIDALGKAAESGLPHVLESIVQLAPQVSTLITAVGRAVNQALPLLTNLAQGATSSMTGAIGALRGVLSLLNSFGPAVAQGFGQFLTTALLLSHTVGINVLGAFGKLGTAARQALNGIREGEEAVAFGAAAMNAALTLGATLAVQALFDQLAQADEEARKFQQTADEASASLKKMADSGAAALDFINTLATAGGKVPKDPFFLGGEADLSKVQQALGATNTELAKYIALAATVPRGQVIPADFASQAGLDLNKLNGAGQDVVNTLGSLIEEFQLGAKGAFEAAVGSQQFALVSDDVSKKIAATAAQTGDYTGALKQLNDANQAAAQAALHSVGATNGQIQAVIKANTTIDAAGKVTIDYAAALGQLRTEMANTNDAFTSLGEDFVGFTDAFNTLNSTTGSLGDRLVKFAVQANNASLSTDQLNAIANKLTNTFANLTGEELGKLFQGINKMVDETTKQLEAVVPSAADAGSALNQTITPASKKLDDTLQKLNDTFDQLFVRIPGFGEAFNTLNGLTSDLGQGLVDVAEGAKKAGISGQDLDAIAVHLGGALGRLTGTQLGQLFDAVTGQVDSFKQSLDSVIPSVKDLQHNMLIFSLAAFLRELEKLGATRSQVIANINAILNQFGDLGAQAINALSSAGLNPRQFALALSQLLEGGQSAVQQVVNDFGVATGGDIQAIAAQMVALGLTPQTVNQMLGLDAFASASNQIGTDVQKIQVEVTDSVTKTQTALDNFSLDSFLNELEKIGRDRSQVQANINTLLDNFGSLGVQALTALSNSGLSKDQFAIALSGALEGGLPTVQRIVDDFGKATGDDLQATAERLVASGLTQDQVDKILGVNAFGTGVDSVKTKLGELPGIVRGALDDAAKEALAGGLSAGENIYNGMAFGMAISKAGAIEQATNASKSIIDAANQALGNKSPSKVFQGIGENVMKGLANGIASSAHLPVAAMRAAAGSLSDAFATTAASPLPPFAGAGLPTGVAPAAVRGGDHVEIAVDARGAAAGAGVAIGRATADEIHAYRLRFPRR